LNIHSKYYFKKSTKEIVSWHKEIKNRALHSRNYPNPFVDMAGSGLPPFEAGSMGIPGSFDLEERFAKLDGRGEPVSWTGKGFARCWTQCCRAAQEPRRSQGTGPGSHIKVLVLQQISNPSDDQMRVSGSGPLR